MFTLSVYLTGAGAEGVYIAIITTCGSGDCAMNIISTNISAGFEQDIQKRLSLPPDIRLPQNVIDKLNRTPTLDNPLTRKSKRASLNEIGFGKLETYKKIFDLGEGTYATVYLGKSLLTGKNVALKEIRLEHEEGAPCTAIREVSLLRNLRHANIVTLHDIVYTDRILTLVFEFVERDLREYMEELDGMISIANVKLFLVQLLRGLAYCHCRRILHRDLKPQNLLINRMGELKLADFGLARAQSVPTKTYSNEVVTLWYRPPDVLLGSTDYSTHIDLWGVGCILYEMLLHKPMFPGSTTDEQLNLIFQKLGTPSPAVHADICALQAFKNGQFRQHNAKPLLNPPRISPERADLLSKLLKYEGKYRISATDAMRHPMLNCFPAQLFSLPDTESVLSLPGVHFDVWMKFFERAPNRAEMEKEFFSQLDNPLLGKAFKLAIIGEWLAANSLDQGSYTPTNSELLEFWVSKRAPDRLLACEHGVVDYEIEGSKVKTNVLFEAATTAGNLPNIFKDKKCATFEKLQEERFKQEVHEFKQRGSGGGIFGGIGNFKKKWGRD
ncbi:hypothetical protein niasHS_015488 [Heterodera schachtii]|uniref:cyclin-dependent kinase n=1 Tax=Heterodera schachtii TaxID=97005 RepID=A0ABD2I392_HETSC